MLLFVSSDVRKDRILALFVQHLRPVGPDHVCHQLEYHDLPGRNSRIAGFQKLLAAVRVQYGVLREKACHIKPRIAGGGVFIVNEPAAFVSQENVAGDQIVVAETGGCPESAGAGKYFFFVVKPERAAGPGTVGFEFLDRKSVV